LELVVAAFEEKFCAMALAAKQSTAVVVEINFESLIICASKELFFAPAQSNTGNELRRQARPRTDTAIQLSSTHHHNELIQARGSDYFPSFTSSFHP
jgi:hypothetical protein